jgi:hypothetical protein
MLRDSFVARLRDCCVERLRDCCVARLRDFLPFLGDILLNTLFVLTTVQHGPGNLTRISLHEMGLHTLAIQKSEGLKLTKKQSLDFP